MRVLLGGRFPKNSRDLKTGTLEIPEPCEKQGQTPSFFGGSNEFLGQQNNVRDPFFGPSLPRSFSITFFLLAQSLGTIHTG